MSDPRPCSPTEAVQRALGLLAKADNAQNGYQLGTGGYHPITLAAKAIDVPWTQRETIEGGYVTGCDCAGFALSWCYKVQRHRPGYNVGSWATVSDDINCDSAIEDAEHGQDLFRIVTDRPQPGDCLVYPTIRLTGHPLPWIGHVCIVTSTARTASIEWDWQNPRYELLDVAQCKGPNNRTPAVVASDGSIWSHHDTLWPRPEHRTRVLRAVP